MQTTPAPSEHPSMNQNSHNMRSSLSPFSNRRGISKRQVKYCCPHCPRKYTTSTWLENHIKIKHSTRGGQQQLQTLADAGNSRQVLMDDASWHPQSSQRPCCSALSKELRQISSLLKQFIPLIDDVVPLLQDLEAAQPKNYFIEKSHSTALKRRASLSDLRGGQRIKHRGTSPSSFGISIPPESRSARTNEPKTWKNSPITSAVDNQCSTTDDFDNLPSIARYPFSRRTEGSQPLPPQGNAPRHPTLGTKWSRRQLQTAFYQAPKFQDPTNSAASIGLPTEHQHESSPTRCESSWTTSDTKNPGNDFQQLHVLGLSYQEPPQNQSIMRTVQDSRESSPLAFQLGLDDEIDNILQECSFSTPLTANSIDAFTLPTQDMGILEGGSWDPLSSTFDCMNWLSDSSIKKVLCQTRTPLISAHNVGRLSSMVSRSLFRQICSPLETFLLNN